MKCAESGESVNPVEKTDPRNAWCDDNNVVHDGNPARSYPEPQDAWNEDLDSGDKGQRHNSGWNNQFAFPWEIGFYRNFTVGGRLTIR